MTNPHKRFKSEREIIAAINDCHRKANALLKEAEEFDALAEKYFKLPDMVEDAKLKRQEAHKKRESADRLIDTKAKKLGEKLAEFRTSTMLFLADETVQALR